MKHVHALGVSEPETSELNRILHCYIGFTKFATSGTHDHIDLIRTPIWDYVIILRTCSRNAVYNGKEYSEHSHNIEAILAPFQYFYQL